ncbi:MAG TPA: ThiF family adenylyltransferase [Thermomicrobiaceae bacterium]|nr:ThiF family adenylyltransferase [Thermomicrobiaceae bacterium]
MPRHSRRDHRVDELLREPFAIRAGVDLYVSLVVSPRVDGFAFAGRVLGDDLEGRVERLMISGDRFAFHAAFDAPSEFSLPAEFDRQVRAFGGDVQEVLSTLNVAVVGSGGTGSSVCEQLVRLGVRRLVLVDPDTLSASNVTRVYGSTPADVGRPKVEILRDHLQAIAPDVVIDTIEGKVTEEPLARRLVGSDVIFGCTDDNAGRLVLSRVAAYYLKPLIDCGVLISSTDGFLEGIDGRVTVVTPGRACLVCRGRIDMARAQAEQLDPTERAARAAEGYAPELGAVEPAVVSYTTAVASAAVSELLERLIGYGPDIEPGEILLRMHDREISTNVVEPNPRHYCSLDAGLLGVGDATPFLGMTWPSS